MCDHEGKPCPGATCRCECMNCQFPEEIDEAEEGEEEITKITVNEPTVEVNGVWFPVRQVMERLGYESGGDPLRSMDRLTVQLEAARILRELGFGVRDA